VKTNVTYQLDGALPLFKDDVLLGALSFYSTTLREYTTNQIRLLGNSYAPCFRCLGERDASRAD
jgi:hypothetical protein